MSSYWLVLWVFLRVVIRANRLNHVALSQAGRKCHFSSRKASMWVFSMLKSHIACCC